MRNFCLRVGIAFVLLLACRAPVFASPADVRHFDVRGDPRVTMLSADVAQLYVPIDYTIGSVAVAVRH